MIKQQKNKRNRFTDNFVFNVVEIVFFGLSVCLALILLDFVTLIVYAFFFDYLFIVLDKVERIVTMKLMK
jgi:hypothetical protein